MVACGGGDDSGDAAPPACVTLPATCTPSINPTYTEIYSKLLAPSCANPGTGTSCHAPAGNNGGFSVSDMNMTYDNLLGTGGGKVRVEPGMPECSLLMERLASNDPSFWMPKGAPQKLDEGLLCAVQTWIKNGAAK